MLVCLGSKKCGNTVGTCLDVPSERMSTDGIIILVVVGVLTFLIVIVGVVYSCYYRRRQLAARRLHLLPPVAVQTPWQPTFQPMEVLDCRAFDLRTMPPKYQQATNGRQ